MSRINGQWGERWKYFTQKVLAKTIPFRLLQVTIREHINAGLTQFWQQILPPTSALPLEMDRHFPAYRQHLFGWRHGIGWGFLPPRRQPGVAALRP